MHEKILALFRGFMTVGLLSTLLYILIIYWNTSATYSLNIGGMEEASIYNLKMLREEGRLYFDPYHYPYSQNLYTPLYYYTTNFIQDLFFGPLEDVRGYYTLGRQLNIILIFFSALALFALTRIKRIPPTIGLFTPILFLLHVPEHSLAARPDAMKDFLFIGFFLALVLYQEKKFWIWRWLGVLFSVLAVFVKQDIIVYLTVFWLIFAFFYKNRFYLISLALFLSTTVCLALIMQFLSKGLLFENIIFSNIEFSTDFMYRWWRDLKIVGFYSIIPFTLIAFAIFKTGNVDVIRWVVISLICALLAILTSMKFGAAINYFTIYFIALSLTIGFAISSLSNHYKPSLFLAISFGVMAAILGTNFGALDKIEVIKEKNDPEKVNSVELTCAQILDSYPEKRILALDQAFILYLPYEVVFKGFHLIFNQLLYSKFDFEGKASLMLTAKSEEIQLNRIKDEVDVLVLEKNHRSDSIYNQFYKDSFKFDKKIMGYNIYLKK